ncbi:MAG: hypothetical protein JNJ78_22945 [Anaerolineae bacterium]|nr:hypothetical protein [Anaerolineae bacterium]
MEPDSVIQAEKKKERTAPVEFIAPYDLKECILRLRDTRYQVPGYMSFGIDPSFEKIDSSLYRFRIRRTWYDTRYRRHYATVEMRGYLKGIDEQSTAIIARIHFSWGLMALVGLFLAGMLVALLLPLKAVNILMFAGICLLVLGIAVGIAWADRRTLLNLIYRVMRDDLL